MADTVEVPAAQEEEVQEPEVGNITLSDHKQDISSILDKLQVTEVAATTDEAAAAPSAEESEEGPSEVADESETPTEKETTAAPVEAEPSK